MRSVWILGVVALLLVPEPVAAQVLSRASAAVHTSSGSGQDRGSTSSGGSSGGGGSSQGGFGGDDGGSPRGAGLKCPPDQSPLECMRDAWEDAGLADVGGALFFWATVMGEHPYADGSGGYAIPARDEAGRDRPARVSLRMEFEAGYVLAEAGRVAGAARLQLPFFIDLATRYSLFVEPGADDIAAFTLGRIDLEVRLIDANGLQLRLGAGARHAHDALGSVFGGGVGLGLDVFPVQPLILSLSADVGVVGHALLVGLRATLGLIVERTEIYVGYHYDGLLGDLTVDLGGPTLGVRVWL